MFNEEEKKIISQLEKLKKIQPDFDYLRSFERVLKTKLSLEETASPPRSRLGWLSLIKLSLATGLGLAFILNLSWGIVLAIQQVSPGTFFYPVKLVSERLQLEMSKDNPMARTELRLKFANNRLTEIKILEENKSLDEEKLSQALASYNSEINAIQQEVLQLVDYQNDDTLNYLLSLESRLEEIVLSLQELTQVAGQSQSFVKATELSHFIKEVVSLKILDYEAQKQIFGQDEKKFLRVASLLSRLKNKQEVLAAEFNRKLSQRLETQSVEINNSGELNVSPAPGQEQQLYQRLRELKIGLNNFTTRLSVVDNDQDLLKLLQALKDYEIQLAEIEQLLK